jgi:hypothetical protein
MPHSKKGFLMAFCRILTLADDSGQNNSNDQVGREFANPSNSLASLTFKDQYWWNKDGLCDMNDQNNYSMLSQLVFPFSPIY